MAKNLPPRRSPKELRVFRAKVSSLKKQGLISKRVDTRSAYPTWKSDGKKLETIVDKWDAVLSGKAKAIKVPASELRKLQKTTGFETSHGRIIVPHATDETVRYDRKTHGIEKEYPSGMSQITTPLSNIDTLPALPKDEFYGFRYYGHDGTEYFRTGKALRKKLESYKNVNVRTGIDDILGIEIFRLNRKAALRIEHKQLERRKARRKR